MLPIILIIIAIIASIVLFGTIVLLIHNSTQKKYYNFVLQNSICLNQVDKINNSYTFYPNICFDQIYTYDNEKIFDTISCEDYLIYHLRYIKKELFNQIDKINTNKQLFSNYINEIKSLTEFGHFNSPTGKLKLNKLIKIEKELFKKNTNRKPTLQFSLVVTLNCSTIQGQVYYKKSKIFYAEDIISLNKRLNNKNGYYYNDREIWDAICRVERGKVSNKLRFSIYERDGHRCCKCGISDTDAKLEIDHIIPISKGGKSTYDNLQTLCHKCNVEKGNTINY